MADKMIENNQVVIMGEIVSPFTFSHQVFGEGFYLVDVMVKRLSESQDIIPVMVSERLVDVSQDYQGEWICISGQFRSYNRHEEKKNRLVLSVFARELSFVEEEDDSVKSNQIYLDGYICKPPVYRKTPLGRDRRPSDRGQPSVWKIRLYPVHLLGAECGVCLCVCRGRPRSHLGTDPEPGIYEAAERDGNGKADRI